MAAALALGATLISGCRCECTDRAFYLVYEPLAEQLPIGAAYLEKDDEVREAFGPVESVEPLWVWLFPERDEGTLGEEEAVRLAYRLRGARGEGEAKVLLVRRAGIWVAVGCAIVVAGETLEVGEVGEVGGFVERAYESSDWDD